MNKETSNHGFHNIEQCCVKLVELKQRITLLPYIQIQIFNASKVN